MWDSSDRLRGVGATDGGGMGWVGDAQSKDNGGITAVAADTLMLDCLGLRAAKLEPVEQPDKAG